MPGIGIDWERDTSFMVMSTFEKSASSAGTLRTPNSSRGSSQAFACGGFSHKASRFFLRSADNRVCLQRFPDQIIKVKRRCRFIMLLRLALRKGARAQD
jgi:hypothetical protein